MADIGFDLNSLLTSPAFQAGAGLLGNSWLPISQNMQGGIQNAQQMQLLPIQRQIAQTHLQQLQNLMNFNPQQFMGGTPASAGAGPATQAAMGQMGMPASEAPAAQPAQPEQGMDMAGMVTAGIKAGMSPQDIMALAQASNPMYFARMQAMTKLMEPMATNPQQKVIIPYEAMQDTGGGNGGVIATNENAPPDSKLGQLNMLQTALAKATPGTPEYQSLSSAIQSISGQFDQQLHLDQLHSLEGQRDFMDQMRQQQQQWQHQQQTQTRVTQFADNVEKTGLPQLQQAIASFKQWAQQNPDMPGFGRAQGALPDAVVAALPGIGDTARQGRQLYNQMMNMELHSQYGARITEAEIKRAQGQLGAGMGMPAQAVMSGVDNLQNVMNSQIANITKGVDPDIVQEYNLRGGSLQLPGIGSQGTAPQPGTQATNAQKTVVRTGTAPNGRKVVQYSDGTTAYVN